MGGCLLFYHNKINQYNEQLIQIRHFSDQKYQVSHVNMKFFFVSQRVIFILAVALSLLSTLIQKKKSRKKCGLQYMCIYIYILLYQLPPTLPVRRFKLDLIREFLKHLIFLYKHSFRYKYY